MQVLSKPNSTSGLVPLQHQSAGDVLFSEVYTLCLQLKSHKLVTRCMWSVSSCLSSCFRHFRKRTKKKTAKTKKQNNPRLSVAAFQLTPNSTKQLESLLFTLAILIVIIETSWCLLDNSQHWWVWSDRENKQLAHTLALVHKSMKIYSRWGNKTHVHMQ